MPTNALSKTVNCVTPGLHFPVKVPKEPLLLPCTKWVVAQHHKTCNSRVLSSASEPQNPGNSNQLQTVSVTRFRLLARVASTTHGKLAGSSLRTNPKLNIQIDSATDTCYLCLGNRLQQRFLKAQHIRSSHLNHLFLPSFCRVTPRLGCKLFRSYDRWISFYGQYKKRVKTKQVFLTPSWLAQYPCLQILILQMDTLIKYHSRKKEKNY